jgi:exopolysaccharide biosynthesis polyprenyl glycosylphosphotransferase
MLKQRALTLSILVFATDLALVAAAFVGAYWARSELLPEVLPGLFPGRLYPFTTYLPLLPLALLTWAALLLRSRSYRSHRTVPIYEEAWAIVRMSLTGAVVFTLIIYVFRLDSLLLGDDLISRLWILLLATLSCVLLLAERVALRLTSRYVRAHGYNYRSLLIVGTGNAAAEMVDSIENHRYWGFRILGFISTNGTPPPAELAARYPVLGTLDDIPTIVENNVVDDVIFAVGRRELGAMEDLFLTLHEQGIRVRFALNQLSEARSRVELEEMDGIPILSFLPAPAGHFQLLGKRALDLAVSAFLLLLAWPLLAAIALAIKLTSGGGVLFRQTRCGLNGRVFTLLKFRTMVEDAELMRADLLHLNEMNGPVFKVRHDPRVTALGRFLRRFSLDELPQLWNVLKGDMSLVGPRPPIPEEVARYARWQRRRLSMKPGLTCLWQISGRNDVDFDRWIALDLEYIDTWSPSLDFKILLKTIPVVLSGKGAS